MVVPTNLKQLRGFMGMVNYYHNMWPHRAHIIAPLREKTDTPKKGAQKPKFVAMMVANVLCAYLNHNLPFDIYTDASDYQLRSCIMQDEKTVAYYSKKLNSAQKNYSMIDKELLSIVMTLKFRSMLLGAIINIHTNHKNILHLGDSSQRRLQWISYVDKKWSYVA